MTLPDPMLLTEAGDFPIPRGDCASCPRGEWATALLGDVEPASVCVMLFLLSGLGERWGFMDALLGELATSMTIPKSSSLSTGLYGGVTWRAFLDGGGWVRLTGVADLFVAALEPLPDSWELVADDRGLGAEAEYAGAGLGDGTGLLTGFGLDGLRGEGTMAGLGTLKSGPGPGAVVADPLLASS